MASVTFDTHKFVKKLEAAGMPVGQAEAIASAMQDSHDNSELVTKSDLREVRKDLQILETKVDGRFSLVQWMLGILLAGVASLILKAFF